MEVDPQDLEDGASDDERVEPVERRSEEVGHAQRVHPNAHLEDESAQEQELGVVCKRSRGLTNGWGVFLGGNFPGRNAEVPLEAINLFSSHLLSPSGYFC